jgi:hypothetical protein
MRSGADVLHRDGLVAAFWRDDRLLLIRPDPPAPLRKLSCRFPFIPSLFPFCCGIKFGVDSHICNQWRQTLSAHLSRLFFHSWLSTATASVGIALNFGLPNIPFLMMFAFHLRIAQSFERASFDVRSCFS